MTVKKKKICQRCKDKDAKDVKPYYIVSSGESALRVWCMKCFLKNQKEQFEANNYERPGDE